jgi:polyisoprenoid-binding protein YceI
MPRLVPGLVAGLALAVAATSAAVVVPGAWAQNTHGVTQDPAAAPAGVYKLDKRHTSIIARVTHFGLSHFAMRLGITEGTVTWDPADPTRSKLDVTIDPQSLNTGVPQLDKEVTGGLFDAVDNPVMRFVSTKIERTGPNTGRITGDLTFHGVTKPVVLDTVFDGTGKPFGGARLGFSATGSFKTSAFGADKFTQYVSDDVRLEIETEASQ